MTRSLWSGFNHGFSKATDIEQDIEHLVIGELVSIRFRPDSTCFLEPLARDPRMEMQHLVHP